VSGRPCRASVAVRPLICQLFYLNYLAALTCDAENFDNAAWPHNTAANTLATGACAIGYQGNPTRLCLSTGQWSTDVSNRCTRASIAYAGVCLLCA